jgi:hypothetical protein
LIIEQVTPYLPVILWTLVALAAVLLMLTNDRFSSFIRETIAAVYKVALRVAVDMGEGGLEWLHSEEGIRFRKNLAERAYDAIPSSAGPFPVGLLKLWITREGFVLLVQRAFDEMTELADTLEAVHQEEVLTEKQQMRGDV